MLGQNSRKRSSDIVTNGAAKGSSFERTISKELSLWWSEGMHDDWFWRTGGSGGRATNRARTGKTTANGAGDICAQTVEAQKLLDWFCVELKRGYQTASISDLLDSKNGGTMRSFIDQAARSAKVAKAPFWILLHKRNRRDTVVLTNCTWFTIGGAVYIRTECSNDDVFCLKYSDCFTRKARNIVQGKMQAYGA